MCMFLFFIFLTWWDHYWCKWLWTVFRILFWKKRRDLELIFEELILRRSAFMVVKHDVNGGLLFWKKEVFFVYFIFSTQFWGFVLKIVFILKHYVCIFTLFIVNYDVWVFLFWKRRSAELIFLWNVIYKAWCPCERLLFWQ